MNYIHTRIAICIFLSLTLYCCRPKAIESDNYAKTETIDTATNNSDYYEYTLEGLSDNYIGKYDIKPLIKMKNMDYHSVYESEPYYDSLREGMEGYMGVVSITNFSRKGFDFEITVILYSHSNGGIAGRAIFDTANRAYSTKSNRFDSSECILTFTFLQDTLLLNQHNCTEYHGGSCQFEGEYVLKNESAAQ